MSRWQLTRCVWLGLVGTSLLLLTAPRVWGQAGSGVTAGGALVDHRMEGPSVIKHWFTPEGEDPVGEGPFAPEHLPEAPWDRCQSLDTTNRMVKLSAQWYMNVGRVRSWTMEIGGLAIGHKEYEGEGELSDVVKGEVQLKVSGVYRVDVEYELGGNGAYSDTIHRCKERWWVTVEWENGYWPPVGPGTPAPPDPPQQIGGVYSEYMVCMPVSKDLHSLILLFDYYVPAGLTPLLRPVTSVQGWFHFTRYAEPPVKTLAPGQPQWGQWSHTVTVAQKGYYQWRVKVRLNWSGGYEDREFVGGFDLDWDRVDPDTGDPKPVINDWWGYGSPRPEVEPGDPGTGTSGDPWEPEGHDGWFVPSDTQVDRLKGALDRVKRLPPWGPILDKLESARNGTAGEWEPAPLWRTPRPRGMDAVAGDLYRHELGTGLTNSQVLGATAQFSMGGTPQAINGTANTLGEWKADVRGTLRVGLWCMWLVSAVVWVRGQVKV